VDREYLNDLSQIVLDSSIEVHRNLGPGLLESTYEICLCKELYSRNVKYLRQVFLPVNYKGEQLNADYRIDLLIEYELIIELKSVDTLLPVHFAQLLTYLRLSDKKLGLLINFNVPRLVDGVRRVVNNF
jgi:GxxExxY protein